MNRKIKLSNIYGTFKKLETFPKLDVEKPLQKCSVCGTTENVKWVGGYQPYLCNSLDCIPF